MRLYDVCSLHDTIIFSFTCSATHSSFSFWSSCVTDDLSIFVHVSMLDINDCCSQNKISSHLFFQWSWLQSEIQREVKAILAAKSKMKSDFCFDNISLWFWLSFQQKWSRSLFNFVRFVHSVMERTQKWNAQAFREVVHFLVSINSFSSQQKCRRWKRTRNGAQAPSNRGAVRLFMFFSWSLMFVRWTVRRVRV